MQQGLKAVQGTGMSGSVFATMSGVQTMMREVLGLKRFALSTNDNPKQGVRNAFGSTEFPYGWFKLTTVALKRDGILLKNVGRFGSGFAMNHESSATISRNYQFPSTISLECVVKFEAYKDAVAFATNLILSSALEMLAFSIETSTYKTLVSVILDGDSVSMPTETSMNDGGTPGSPEITFSLTISTQFSFTREGAKINDAGAVTYNVDTI